MNFLSKIFSRKKEITQKPLSAIDEFFQELNRAYRDNQPSLQYSIQGMSDAEFQSISRCLIGYHNLSVDLKVKKTGTPGITNEILIVNLKDVYVAKNQGFSFVDTISQVKSPSTPRQIEIKITSREKIPIVKHYHDNVIHVDFSQNKSKIS